MSDALTSAPASAGSDSAPSVPAALAPIAAPMEASPVQASTAGAGTTAADPLAELRGIHLPQPVGVWPPAPGWWGLTALLLAGAVATTIIARRRRQSVVRHALRELDGLARLSSPDGDLQMLATTLSALIRRVALLRFGRQRVASLHGRAWQDFLAETAPKKPRRRARFVENAGLVLSLAPYAPAGAPCVERDGEPIDRRLLIAATRAWIEENA